jgi:hypothetical protein
MSAKNTDRLTKALNLRRAIVDDAEEITAEDAAKELLARGTEPSDAVAATRAMATELLIQSRKARLRGAQQAVAAHQPSDKIDQRDVHAISRALTRLASDPATMAGKRIALAHRNGKTQSEQDVLSLWQDLLDLGAVSDDDLVD